MISQVHHARLAFQGPFLLPPSQDSLLSADCSVERRPVLCALRIDIDLTGLQEVQDCIDFALVSILMEIGIWRMVVRGVG